MEKIEAKIYSQDGKETGVITLPESVFGVKWNADLVHQVVVSMESNARQPVAHTKDRGEVSGGGKKPWKQKGTGRARHGSTRSPIWRHGGVTHGPRNEKDYSRKVNKKMKAKALFTIMSRKLKDGEVMFVNNLSFKEPKTKNAKEVIASLSKGGFETLATKRKNAAFIAVMDKNKNLAKSFSNFGNIEVDKFVNLNPLHLLQYKYLIITNPADAIKFFEGKLSRS